MLKQKNILDEKNNFLRQKSNEVTFPLSVEDKKLIKDILKYLELSQDEEYAQKHNIRAGMGLAFPQLKKHKRIFIISLLRDDNNFEEYIVINPKILSHSEELIYMFENGL